MSKDKTITTNKKAYHDYHIFETYQAGMVLTGTEIKSIRAGRINLKDSFVKIENGEVWLYKAHISPYDMGNRYNHEPERKRKLLLTKPEIRKLIGKTKESGNALIPLKLYFSNGWAKVEIGLAKGKKLYDKREALAKKDTKRELERALKDKH
ncbi:MAG: SsrA-binding protein [Candidatus Melainabacteria bacterium RIFOXYA12_FULL_32_12]|nr:MAG: SsrA-binding protein [Candidatus Melainabacteria bacterium RIFOXYA2_FULL_32_9]OGI29377.1 MAG: SsrA-binding protein [Candidatus Melainabacteria bacterium RIFOXYA12_FULL_32_12]